MESFDLAPIEIFNCNGVPIYEVNLDGTKIWELPIVETTGAAYTLDTSIEIAKHSTLGVITKTTDGYWTNGSKFLGKKMNVLFYRMTYQGCFCFDNLLTRCI